MQLAAASDAANNIPEHIGFLKEIGLDYGYGPTAMLEWTLEHMHITFGLPWWGAIAATAILVRAVTFPLYLRSSDQAARQSAMSTVMKPISERMQAAQKAGDQTGVMQAWSEMSAARQRAGLSYGKQFTPMLVQSVLGFCSFKLMRGMANLPVPSLKEGGFGWITDLTVSDGYLLLPAMMAGAMHVMFRYGGETGNNEMMNPGMKSFMLWGMPGIIFVITGWQPGALCIWFVASGGWAMGQAMLMQKPGVRKFFGLTPMYKKAEDQASGSGGGLADQLRSHMESKRGGRTIDATATSKPAGLATMSYQAPKVRTTSARGTPAPAATPASGAPKQSESILSKGKDFWSQVKQKQNEWAEQSRASDVKKRAAAHEARAQKKKDLAKGRR